MTMNAVRWMTMLLCCVCLLVCSGPVFADESAVLPDPSRAKRARPGGKKNGAPTPAAPAAPASPADPAGATPSADPSKPATHDSRLNSILEGLLELNKVTPPEQAPPAAAPSAPSSAPTASPAKDLATPSGLSPSAVRTALALARHELLFAYAAIGQVADLHVKEVYDRQWALTMLGAYSKTLSEGRAAVESLKPLASAEEKTAAEGLAGIYELLLQETQAYKLFVESGDKGHLLTFSSRRKDVQTKIQELVKVKRPAGPKPAGKE